MSYLSLLEDFEITRILLRKRPECFGKLMVEIFILNFFHQTKKINVNAKRFNSHTTIFISGSNIENKSAEISPIYTNLKDENTRLGFLHALRGWAAARAGVIGKYSDPSLD